MVFMRRKPDELIPLEVAVLEAAFRLRRKGTSAFHGYSLAKTIKTDSDRRALTAHGTLYRALHRLQAAGLIEGFWEQPGDAERQNRPPRRLYRLTASAEPVLARARQQQRGGGRLRSLKEGRAT